MTKHLFNTTLCTLLMLGAGCSPDENIKTPPVTPVPDVESCAMFLTEKECFDYGCHAFSNAAQLTFEDNTCSRGQGRGTCLYAPDIDDAPDTLTFYQRTQDDGTVEVLQLNVDTPLEGWQRCGHLDAPPDCDCDGVRDPSDF